MKIHANDYHSREEALKTQNVALSTGLSSMRKSLEDKNKEAAEWKERAFTSISNTSLSTINTQPVATSGKH